MSEDYPNFLKPEREPKGNPLLRNKGLRAKSDKQAILDAKWSGIKEAFLYLMTRYDPDGPCCEECGRKGNAGSLDLHHIRRRGQGGEYAARNAELVCRPCHQALDGNDLRWSRDD